MKSMSPKTGVRALRPHLPVFGAGQGGNSLEDAVSGMLKGFKEYFAKPKQLPVEEIGLCIYNSAHIEPIKNIFVEEGFQLV